LTRYQILRREELWAGNLHGQGLRLLLITAPRVGESQNLILLPNLELLKKKPMKESFGWK
jgi:hypothetical protein